MIAALAIFVASIPLAITGQRLPLANLHPDDDEALQDAGRGEGKEAVHFGSVTK